MTKALQINAQCLITIESKVQAFYVKITNISIFGNIDIVYMNKYMYKSPMLNK